MANLDIMLLALAGTTVCLFIVCIILIIKIVQTIRNKRGNTALLKEIIAPLMEIAEKFQNYSGEEKKEYVITKINQFAIENKLKFDEKAKLKKIEFKITDKVSESIRLVYY